MDEESMIGVCLGGSFVKVLIVGIYLQREPNGWRCENRGQPCWLRVKKSPQSLCMWPTQTAASMWMTTTGWYHTE